MEPPPWWNNYDTFLSSWLFGHKELKSKTVLAGLSPRMADVVLKVVSGKEFGGGQRLEEGVPLDLFHPNAIEARDRSRVCQGHCTFLHL